MKIAIGLSGGVDSAVAAKILKDEGHEVIGLFLKLWQDPTSSSELRGASPQCAKENRCCDAEALLDARRVAQKLDIPLYVINARDEFKKAVVDNFLDEYKALRTPNPCIICNEKIKFDLMLRKAISLGCDKLATGHYARITSVNDKSQETNNKQNPNPNIQENKQFINKTIYQLFTGIDSSKDQSYMLYRLNQKQLSHIIFPLGEMTKKEVRKLALDWKLPVKEKPESQEICFFGDRDYRDFLKRYLDKKSFEPGDIIAVDGKVVGKHNGLINYTIGQRKGVSQEITNDKRQITNKISNSKSQNTVIASEAKQSSNSVISTEVEKSLDIQPLYVTGFNVSKNHLIVGDDEEVYKKDMTVTDLNWISDCHPELYMCHPELVSGSLKVKIRYRHEAVPCKIKFEEATRADTDNNYRSKSVERHVNKLTNKQINKLQVIFDQPQRAVTPGQSAVFYMGNEVLGGGIIQ